MVDLKDEEFPVEVTAAPIMNEAGELVGTMIVFRDISQRREDRNRRFAQPNGSTRRAVCRRRSRTRFAIRSTR